MGSRLQLRTPWAPGERSEPQAWPWPRLRQERARAGARATSRRIARRRPTSACGDAAAVARPATENMALARPTGVGRAISTYTIPIEGRDQWLAAAGCGHETARQIDVLTAFVAARESVANAAASIGIRPSTANRHMADLRARSGLSTEQVIYRGRAEGWLVVPALEPATPVPPELHDAPATSRPSPCLLKDPRGLRVSTETATATSGPHLGREASSRRGMA